MRNVKLSGSLREVGDDIGFGICWMARANLIHKVLASFKVRFMRSRKPSKGGISQETLRSTRHSERTNLRN